MAEDPDPQDPVDWKAVAAQFANGLLTEGVPGLLKAWQAAHIETNGAVRALDVNLAEDMALLAGQKMHDLVEPFLPLIAAFVAPILGGLFGADFDASEFRGLMGRGAGNRGAAAILDGFMKAIVGDTPAEIVPSDAGSKRVAAAAVQAELESGFNALAFEAISHMVPFDLAHFNGVRDLPEGIIRSLGVSRLVRRALQPIVTTCCTTPATWHMNKLHRPTLLGASALAKQIARHPDDREKWLEDLRREGYSEDRIEALLNEQAKFHSVADVDLLVRASQWGREDALRHLRDQGYDEAVADVELQIEEIKRINAFERSMADAAVDGYVAGRIDEGTMGGFLSGATLTARDKARYDELAAARRICGRRPLTAAEAAAAVEAGVLSFRDYRGVLTREGRDDEAVDVLELLLRKKLDDKADLAELRAHQAEQKAADKQQREADAAERKAAADDKLALSKRGRITDLEQAYIRGLLPIDRVADVYAATYDPDTVGILIALVETKRAAYVAQQAAAEAAKTRAATRGIDVGQLEQAVLQGVLTLAEFRRRLDDLTFAPGDAELLAATLAAKLDAQHAADDAHAAAVAAAKVKHVDLATVEMLVRRGHGTIAGYRDTLRALGYDDIAQAALVERLQILIDDDAAAAKVRADAAARAASKGLSLEQARRAVILGIVPIAQFATFLLDNHFGADAIRVLVAELQADVDEAAAARARRTAVDLRVQGGKIPLSDLRRAARLGLVDVETYYARLRREGYTADDVAIESDLLATEIAHDAGAAARGRAADAAPPSRGLTLTQLAAAVKAGQATLDDYEARALAIGLGADDAAILRRVLQDELQTAAAAARRRAELAAGAPARELARADMAKAVTDGLRSVAEYGAWLVEQGYDDDDAALLVAELEIALDAKAAKAAGGGL